MPQVFSSFAERWGGADRNRTSSWCSSTTRTVHHTCEVWHLRPWLCTWRSSSTFTSSTTSSTTCTWPWRCCGGSPSRRYGRSTFGPTGLWSWRMLVSRTSTTCWTEENGSKRGETSPQFGPPSDWGFCTSIGATWSHGPWMHQLSQEAEVCNMWKNEETFAAETYEFEGDGVLQRQGLHGLRLLARHQRHQAHVLAHLGPSWWLQFVYLVTIEIPWRRLEDLPQLLGTVGWISKTDPSRPRWRFWRNLCRDDRTSLWTGLQCSRSPLAEWRSRELQQSFSICCRAHHRWTTACWTRWDADTWHHCLSSHEWQGADFRGQCKPVAFWEESADAFRLAGPRGANRSSTRTRTRWRTSATATHQSTSRYAHFPVQDRPCTPHSCQQEGPTFTAYLWTWGASGFLEKREAEEGQTSTTWMVSRHHYRTSSWHRRGQPEQLLGVFKWKTHPRVQGAAQTYIRYGALAHWGGGPSELPGGRPRLLRGRDWRWSARRRWWCFSRSRFGDGGSPARGRGVHTNYTDRYASRRPRRSRSSSRSRRTRRDGCGYQSEGAFDTKRRNSTSPRFTTSSQSKQSTRHSSCWTTTTKTSRTSDTSPLIGVRTFSKTTKDRWTTWRKSTWGDGEQHLRAAVPLREARHTELKRLHDQERPKGLGERGPVVNDPRWAEARLQRCPGKRMGYMAEIWSRGGAEQRGVQLRLSECGLLPHPQHQSLLQEQERRVPLDAHQVQGKNRLQRRHGSRPLVAAQRCTDVGKIVADGDFADRHIDGRLVHVQRGHHRSLSPRRSVFGQSKRATLPSATSRRTSWTFPRPTFAGGSWNLWFGKFSTPILEASQRYSTSARLRAVHFGQSLVFLLPGQQADPGSWRTRRRFDRHREAWRSGQGPQEASRHLRLRRLGWWQRR